MASLSITNAGVEKSASVIPDISRVGREWEDSLEGCDASIYPHQKFKTIPTAELSNENLPPYHYKLSDEQVGHLLNAVHLKSISISQGRLAELWAADFMTGGKIRKDRENFAEAFKPRERLFSDDKLNGRHLRGSRRSVSVSVMDNYFAGDVRARTFVSAGRLMAEDPEHPAFEKQLATESDQLAERPLASSAKRRRGDERTELRDSQSQRPRSQTSWSSSQSRTNLSSSIVTPDSPIAEVSSKLEDALAKLSRAELEIMKLKAQIYDLMQ